jgi:membrane-associated phospholipid phosphatase
VELPEKAGDFARHDKSGYDGNLFVKRAAVFYWLTGLAIAAIAIGAAFYLDNTVWHFLVQHRTRAMLHCMRNVSRFGNWPAHVALGLLLLGIAWQRGSQKWMRVFLCMLIAMALAGLAGAVIKRAVPRARPAVKSELRWGGPHFSTKYHSFPSGHVAASSAFFSVLFFARRRVGLACLPIPIVIGFSRMYIGAHYFSDVVCAAALGILCALIGWHWARRKTSDVQSN